MAVMRSHLRHYFYVAPNKKINGFRQSERRKGRKECAHKNDGRNNGVHLKNSGTAGQMIKKRVPAIRRNQNKEGSMNTKNETIKLRVTKEQKETLKRLSKQNKESMSSYLLRKGMEEERSAYSSLPDKIDACNLLNEIYHALAMAGERKAGEIFQASLKKYGEGALT